jgi:hypothetical protein
MGATLGAAAAAACVGVTGGVCTLGAPAIISGSTLVFSAAGAGAGTIQENADEIVAGMSEWGDKLKRRAQRAIETVGLIIGLVNLEPPPRRPEDEDRPPPPVTTPKSGNPNPKPD